MEDRGHTGTPQTVPMCKEMIRQKANDKPTSKTNKEMKRQKKKMKMQRAGILKSQTPFHLVWAPTL